MWGSKSYQISDIVSYVPRRSLEWWGYSLMNRFPLMLTLSLILPRRGTPTPLSVSGPASSGILRYYYGNLLILLNHGWW